MKLFGMQVVECDDIRTDDVLFCKEVRTPLKAELVGGRIVLREMRQFEVLGKITNVKPDNG